jgi:pyruvate/2-oxoglutarate dehydrogenase complex dihydrolipoamide acyltransferase (E2) component
MDIKLPELGEGVESGDVVKVLVKEGDTISKDQGLIELETDKASVEIPSTHAGKVTKIHVKAGDKLKPGGAIVSLESSSAEGVAPKKAPPKAENGKRQGEASEREGEAPAEPAPPKTQATKPSPKAQPAAQDGDDDDEDAPPPKPAPKPPAAPRREHPVEQPALSAVAETTNGGGIAAGPAMRRFAREVGVDLSLVEGSGPGGRITRSDILRVVREGSRATAGTLTEEAPLPKAPPEKLPGEAGHDAWGRIRVEKLPKIRQTIAHRMHESWTSIPKVTNFDDADVTELEHIRESSKDDYASAGIKLTALPFVVKACAQALRANPVLNASIDLEKNEVIYKDYVHIGIAVDTERGLIVPSLRHADRKSIPEIARDLATLSEKVRTGKFTVEDLRGSTFTISNLGAIGGTYSTPIINPPEVAILLVGRARKMPVVVDHQFAVRLLMPLSLSYDHRLVDGAAAARYLNDVKGFLQSPSRLLLAP